MSLTVMHGMLKDALDKITARRTSIKKTNRYEYITN